MFILLLGFSASVTCMVSSNEVLQSNYTIVDIRQDSVNGFRRLEKILKEMNQEVGTNILWINGKESITVAISQSAVERLIYRLKNETIGPYEIISAQWNDTERPNNDDGNLKRSWVDSNFVRTQEENEPPIFNRVIYQIIHPDGKILSLLNTSRNVTGATEENNIAFVLPSDADIISPYWYFVISEKKAVNCGEFSFYQTEECTGLIVDMYSAHEEYVSQKIKQDISNNYFNSLYLQFRFENLSNAANPNVMIVVKEKTSAFIFPIYNESDTLITKYQIGLVIQFAAGNLHFILEEITSQTKETFLLPRAIIENYTPTIHTINIEYDRDQSIYIDAFWGDLKSLLGIDVISAMFPKFSEDHYKWFQNQKFDVEKNSSCVLSQGSITYHPEDSGVEITFAIVMSGLGLNGGNHISSISLNDLIPNMQSYFPNAKQLIKNDASSFLYKGIFFGNTVELTFFHSEIICQQIEAYDCNAKSVKPSLLINQ